MRTGQTLTEYVLVLLGIVALAVGAYVLLGQHLNTIAGGAEAALVEARR